MTTFIGGPSSPLLHRFGAFTVQSAALVSAFRRQLSSDQGRFVTAVAPTGLEIRFPSLSSRQGEVSYAYA
jgi:hypothetical protein